MSEFIIQQGTDSGISWPITDKEGLAIDFTGWSGVTQIRAIKTDKLLHTFTTTDNTMILDDSKVTLVWTSAETSAWTWKQAKYGVELTNPEGKKARIKQDIVTLSPEVTK